MPQFDLSTYSSQIFWFLLCFGALYAAMHFVILPRIRQIISERENLVDSDRSMTAASEKKFNELQIKTEELRRQASKKYQNQLEESAKLAAKEREKSLEDLKAKVEGMTQKSQREIKEFFEKSQNNIDSAVKNLTKTIKEKIFS